MTINQIDRHVSKYGLWGRNHTNHVTVLTSSFHSI